MALVIVGGNANSAAPSDQDVDVGDALKALIDLVGTVSAFQIAFNGSPAFASQFSTLISMSPKI